jgi:quercetin dioxygenase-like cupin family protein
MNMSAIMTVALSLGASSTLAEPDKGVTVTRAGMHPSMSGPASNFTGAVRVDSRFSATTPTTVGGGTGTFEPGARTAWHTHTLGQTLIVTAGVGLVQHWECEVQEIRPGDIA